MHVVRNKHAITLVGSTRDRFCFRRHISEQIVFGQTLVDVAIVRLSIVTKATGDDHRHKTELFILPDSVDLRPHILELVLSDHFVCGGRIIKPSVEDSNTSTVRAFQNNIGYIMCCAANVQYTTVNWGGLKRILPVENQVGSVRITIICQWSTAVLRRSGVIIAIKTCNAEVSPIVTRILQAN